MSGKAANPNKRRDQTSAVSASSNAAAVIAAAAAANNSSHSSSGSSSASTSPASVAPPTPSNVAATSGNSSLSPSSSSGVANAAANSSSAAAAAASPVTAPTPAIVAAAAAAAAATAAAAAAAAAAASESMSSDLASLFECPVCFDYVLPPILQCQSGHLVCSSCRSKLTCCPTCRGNLGNIRNLAMEKVASNVKFPCKHSSYGCSVSLVYTEKAEHEETCECRPYLCPCPGASCKWQGALELVMPHLMVSHKSITTLQGEDIVFLATDINLPGAVDWVMMQSCFGHHFMLVLEKQEKFDGHQQFFAIVQLIGSRKEAENFAYRLELNGHRRRLTWEAMPRSIHEGVAGAIVNSDCLVFDTSIAQLFADNGNLGINVTISIV